MALLEAHGLKKNFGKVQALRGVDLDVNEGEVYGFIGPNGAGKSTTIRILLGILRASEGTAQIFGRDVWKDAVEIHKNIAFIPGEMNVWNNLSGGEMIDVLLRMRGVRDARYKQELIEQFDFDPTKKCGSYSKGNKQKIALIAAFSSDAELYIFDEPTSGLDPLMGTAFKECVRTVKAQGKSVLLSSHILSEVEDLADRISVIKLGKIVDSGTLEDMRHLTRNNVSAALNTSAEKILPKLNALKGVYGADVKNGRLSFQMDNNATEEIMSFLVKHGVTHLNSTPPTLEELFIQHYDADENGADTIDGAKSDVAEVDVAENNIAESEA
ncbi:MAG: ABC transporter ATP-binding protein [Coriobacteriia bacterium]|nr:ABC transporter ATP-binding protein [Coriobacteriia bacterium]